MTGWSGSTGSGWGPAGGWVPWVGKKTGPNPTDRGKLGTKRSVVTDARGVPVGFAVDGANVPDYKLLEETLDAMPVKPPETLAGSSLNLCLDKGYDYDGPRQIAYDYNLTAHIRCRGEESKHYPTSQTTSHGAGWSNACTPGSIASDACSFVGRRSLRTTRLCSSSPVASSLGNRPPYWDRFLGSRLAETVQG